MKKLLLITGLLWSSATLSNTSLQSVEEVLRISETLNNTSSHIDGPNCWNGALYTAGVLKHKRFLHPSEWLYHLEKSCVEIVGEPELGDVGRIFVSGEIDPERGEVHGFIHLDNDTIFAKHGEATMWGYEVMTYDKMLEDYERTRRCRMRQSFDEECFHEIRYYRCQSKAQKPASLLTISSLLEELTFSEETDHKYKDTCESKSFLKKVELLEKIEKEVKELKEEVLASIENGDRDKNLYIIKISLSSFIHQIYNIQVANRAYRCESRSEKMAPTKVVKDLLREVEALLN